MCVYFVKNYAFYSKYKKEVRKIISIYLRNMLHMVIMTTHYYVKRTYIHLQQTSLKPK